MTFKSLPCRCVMGIQLLSFGATVACAQTFTFDFTSDAQEGVYRDPGGTSIIEDWDGSSNPFDFPTRGAEIQKSSSGSVFFRFNGETSLTSMTLGAGDYLNWTGSGLGDAGSGFNASGDSIHFVFDRPMRIEGLEFGGFTSAGMDGVDSLTLSRGESYERLFEATKPRGDGDFSIDLDLAAGQTMGIEWNNAEFYLESMTLSAVPEPGTIVFSALGASVALLLSRRRPRGKTN